MAQEKATVLVLLRIVINLLLLIEQSDVNLREIHFLFIIHVEDMPDKEIFEYEALIDRCIHR